MLKVKVEKNYSQTFIQKQVEASLTDFKMDEIIFFLKIRVIDPNIKLLIDITNNNSFLFVKKYFKSIFLQRRRINASKYQFGLDFNKF